MSVAPPPERGPTIRPIEFTPRGSPAPAPVGRFPRLASLLVLALLAALAVAAGFVVTARSVLLEVEPPPARLEVEGGLAVELGGRHLLRPGTYVLHAEKEGFRPLRATFEVDRGADQTFHFELERLPGLLVVVAPDGAEVLVDGETAGPAPLELAAGEHEVRVRLPGHRELVRRIAIEGGGLTQTLQAQLEPLPAPAPVPSAPPAAPAEATVVVLSEPEGATVTVDGTYRGRTPLDLRLAPGSHALRASKAGHGAASRDLELRAGEEREVRFALPALEGEVEIVGWPPDAEVLVDGEARGQARQTLRLPAVPHEIEVRKPGHEPFRASVTPMPGVPQSLEVRLETLEERQAAATPSTLRTTEGQELVRVEPGRFVMGASRREPGRRANEALREVEITRAYYLGAREVTNAEFRRYRPEHRSGQVGGRSLDLDDHPAVTVTWEEAAAYCNWLSAREDLPPAYVVRAGRLVGVDPLSTGYRLPTEAEWAWAARFAGRGAALKYPWGETLPAAGGNYADVSARDVLPAVLRDYDDGFPVTAPVASFAANALGIHDLGGNVAEWVHDLYDIRPPGGGEVARDPTGPESGEFHVIRGASWMHSTVTELRLTFRDYGDQARPDVGFRLARYSD